LILFLNVLYTYAPENNGLLLNFKNATKIHLHFSSLQNFNNQSKHFAKEKQGMSFIKTNKLSTLTRKWTVE